jgi:hypothetical protein
MNDAVQGISSTGPFALLLDETGPDPVRDVVKDAG